MACLLLGLSLSLYYAIGLGLHLDKWLYQLTISFFVFVALVILMVRLLLQMAMAHMIKQPVVLRYLRRVLIATFSLFSVLKPMFKNSFHALERDFIAMNNQLVLDLDLRFKPSDILILTPHCLQNSNCPIKVSVTIEACESCGQCRIGDLKGMKQAVGIDVVVATGGTLARKTIADRKPKLIIAVACERDLVSGIMDTQRIFTFGILNQKPKGPCLDTTVQIDLVQQAIDRFINQ